MDTLYQKAREGAERDRMFRRLLRDGAMGFGEGPRPDLPDPRPYVAFRVGPHGRPGIEIGLKGTF